MPFSNYTELKAEMTDWMARNDVTGKAADCISLGEARLNRLLGPVGTTASLTGTISSRLVDISALSIIEPTSLFITYNNFETEITPQPLGTFEETTNNAVPTRWAIEGTNIRFDCLCSEAFPLRFTYQGRFALSDLVPTNEFLTNNPDLYLAASLVWGNAYVKDLPAAALWKQMLDEFTAEVAHNNARKKKAELTVDPMLSLIGTRYTSRTFVS